MLSATHRILRGVEWRGDDDARFDAALASLGLTPARAVFLSHFGGMMLASLYTHLEALDQPLDVRAAWREVSTSTAAAA